MSQRRVIIVGAGGHARVVADALLGCGLDVAGFTDPAMVRGAPALGGLAVLGCDDDLDRLADRAVTDLANGIGFAEQAGASRREQAQARLVAAGWTFPAVVHRAATVSPFATVADGAIVLAGAVIQPGARVEPGAVVNSGAIVEHDAVVGGWSHVAPGAVLCGQVVVGLRCYVGAGAVIRQGVRLGESTLVAAGSVVIEDTVPGSTVLGVPARSRRTMP